LAPGLKTGGFFMPSGSAGLFNRESGPKVRNQCYFNVIFRGFPRENEKNNGATLIRVNLISVALSHTL
jgi:hypothetical protein